MYCIAPVHVHVTHIIITKNLWLLYPNKHILIPRTIRDIARKYRFELPCLSSFVNKKIRVKDLKCTVKKNVKTLTIFFFFDKI